MKALGSVLLAYLLAVSLICTFSPIPFLGLAAGFLAFPLALKISRRDLFLISLIHYAAIFTIRVDILFSQFVSGLSMLEPFGLNIWAHIYQLIFWPMLVIMLIVASVFYAIGVKLLSRFTPERIKFVVLGNA